MRPLSTSRPRRSALATIIALGALVLPPAAALAAGGEPDPSDAPPLVDDVATSEPQAGTCDDLLVAFSRDRVTGVAHSVALTAQALDRDTDGWLLLAWQVADGTDLTDVIATASDGTTRHLAPAPTGTVEHVTTLTFCGRHAAPEGLAGDPSAPGTAPGTAAPAATSTRPANPARPADPNPDPDPDPDNAATAAPLEVDRPGDAVDAVDAQATAGATHRAPSPASVHGDDGGDETRAGRVNEPVTVTRAVAAREVTGAGASADPGPSTVGVAVPDRPTLASAVTAQSRFTPVASEPPVARLQPWLLVALLGAGLACGGGVLLRARTRATVATSQTPDPNGPEAGR